MIRERTAELERWNARLELAEAMIPLIGEDSIMWGSDYPHPDGIWPDSQKWIAEDLAGVSPAVQRKIVCENAGKLYGLL